MLMEDYSSTDAILQAYCSSRRLRIAPSQSSRSIPCAASSARSVHAQHRPDPDRGPAAARIPRLRLLRRRRARRTALKRARSTVARGRAADPGRTTSSSRAPPASPTRAGPRTARRPCTTRIRTSAMARAERQRKRRAHRAGAQRHHREPRRAARRAEGAAATCSRARPTPRSSRTWSTASTTATCSRPCSARVAAAARRLRDRRVLPRRAAPRGRRARRARRWSWASATARTSSPRDAMALAGVTDQIVYLEEGDVVDLQLGKLLDRRPRARAAPVAARGAHRARAQRRGRAGPVPPLHAEGNLRAAARDRRHARRRRRASCRSCSATARTACSRTSTRC